MIIGEAAVLLAFGLGAGVLLSLAGGRAAASMLFNLQPHDPAILAVAAFLLVTVAMAASYLPARRAMKVDPLVALRFE
jgi:ABC-type antimicrobial peptide transport system permease subunit